MVILGDPTLDVYEGNQMLPSIEFIRPENRVYINDNELFPWLKPVIFGNISLKARVINPGYGLINVSLYVDDQLWSIDDEAPFDFFLDYENVGRKTLSMIGIDREGNVASDELIVWIINRS